MAILFKCLLALSGCKRFYQRIRCRASLFSLAAAWLLSACGVLASQDEWGLAWSGKPVEQLTSAWGQPNEQRSQGDGSTEIRYDLTDARCSYWFTVDRGGKIAAYRYVVGQWGSCKPT